MSFLADMRIAFGAMGGGLIVMLLSALLWEPAAELRGHERAMAEVARASAEKILEAVRERHEIEKEIRDADDCTLLRALDPNHPCGVR